ncbi:hypothetical protein IMG5_192860 [Ichthyophthirius multifiliis]|uniref:Uncharacterized protein n=1 Tax=Ichthyophthirius multifiliis TaxID=5932 RepID=G0R4I0_ICHMU|nr:hypothetical protein IMG5_192860 [Ichthyophthirius multifiliis]EGR27631.1 hypothetical protein IMG5_192860 [Ichthyophthirius multifiliis]|eukprot:XP_004025083.1 hypothetical protein IMG5_192860 [Ichthyophthirius multifiliis]
MKMGLIYLQWELVKVWNKQSQGLQMMIRVSIAKDNDGKTFVATMEGIRFPIYINQFHPKKKCF